MPVNAQWNKPMPGEESTPTSNYTEIAWLKQATTRSALKRLGIRSSVLAGQLASVVLFAVFWRHGA
jgi:hypothetical protein